MFGLRADGGNRSVATWASSAAPQVASLAEPFDLELQQVRLGASVGLALGRAGDTASDILRRADAAMYVAKQGGRSRFELAR